MPPETIPTVPALTRSRIALMVRLVDCSAASPGSAPANRRLTIAPVANFNQYRSTILTPDLRWPQLNRLPPGCYFARAGSCGALVSKTRGGDIADPEQLVATLDQCRDDFRRYRRGCRHHHGRNRGGCDRILRVRLRRRRSVRVSHVFRLCLLCRSRGDRCQRTLITHFWHRAPANRSSGICGLR